MLIYLQTSHKKRQSELPSLSLDNSPPLCYNKIMEKSKKKKILIPIAVVLGVLFLLGAVFGFYFGSYYKATLPAGTLQSSDKIRVLQTDDYIAFEPTDGYEDGLIFYQGAKVDEKAYAPMLRQIAEQGILCFLVKMPLNFALFDTDAAEDIIDDFEGNSIDWYVGGHSLGGSMAALCAGENPFLFKGVILFASYATKDLSHLDVLSVYGTQDEVLNMEKYEENKSNLPKHFAEVPIEGGNHANFGYYGDQKGDGKANISREEQIAFTVNAVCTFILPAELA